MEITKMSVKIGIGAAVIVLTLAILFLSPLFFQKKTNEQTNRHEEHAEQSTTDWKTYSSNNIGIQFEIPDYLHAFPIREVMFSESEDGPGFISVQKEFVGEKTVVEIFKEIQVEKNITETVIDRKTINGSEAIITVSNHEDSDQQQKTAYVMRSGFLYTISSRWIDQERFWNSIRFN